MDRREDIIKMLSESKAELADRFKVDNLGLFGSFGRSEQNMESDIDILVEFRQGADLLDLVALGEFLEKKLGRRVDIVTKRALRPEIRDQVLKEVSMV